MDLPDHPGAPARACFIGGELAAFGFNTRNGSIWTCMNHRAEGDKRLVTPAASAIKATFGWAPGTGR